MRQIVLQHFSVSTSGCELRTTLIRRPVSNIKHQNSEKISLISGVISSWQSGRALGEVEAPAAHNTRPAPSAAPRRDCQRPDTAVRDDVSGIHYQSIGNTRTA